MLKDIVAVRPLGAHRLWLEFEDGVQGELDVGRLIRFTGVFEPLRDEAEFGKVAVHPEFGTVFWPNGADLDPDVLYQALAGSSAGTSTGAAGR